MLYGTSYVATAIALRSFSPLGTAAARGLLGVLAIGLVLLLPAASGFRPRRMNAAAAWRLAALAIFGGPAFIAAMNYAVSLAGATVTAFVAGLYAVLAAAFAVPLLGERPETRTVVALGLALIGTGLLADLRLTGETAAGVGVGLVAAVLFALFLVLSRRWSAAHGLPGPTVAFATLGLTAVSIGALLPVLGQGPFDGELRVDAVVAAAWLAVGPGALAAMLVVAGMRRIPARRASAFLLLNPPTAALGAWWLLNESLTPLQLVGGALVLLAIAGAGGLALARPQAG